MRFAPQRWFPMILAVALATVGALQAQKKPGEIPKRPPMPADRDTNSSRDYFYYGASVLSTQPERAAAAFYWAARIDPYWADPLWGQAAAILGSQPVHVINGYYARDRKMLRDPLIRHLDSLSYQALLRNPFVDRRFDAVVYDAFISRATGGQVSLHDLDNSDPWRAAWLSYSYGHFDAAIERYREAVRRYPHNPWLHEERALAFVSRGLSDSAVGEVRSALGIYSTIDTVLTGYLYETLAYTEYSLGALYEQEKQPDSAQAAYERALLEDIRLGAAHRKLARLHLAAGDTARALREYGDATSLDSTDVMALYEYGVLTMAAGHPDSSLMLLKRATKAEPYFPQPHFTLGVIYEHSGFADEAKEEYTTYLGLIPKVMVNEAAAVRGRLERLGGKP